MIKLYRGLACDGYGCDSVSFDVLRTTDVPMDKVPDWQGWREVVSGQHLCPECVAAGNAVAPVVVNDAIGNA